MHSPGFKMEKLFRFYELRKSMYVDPHSLVIFGEATRTNVYFDGIYQSNLSAKFGIQGHIYRHLHQFLFYKLQYVNNGFDTKKTSHFMEGYVGFAKRVTPGVIFFYGAYARVSENLRGAIPIIGLKTKSSNQYQFNLMLPFEGYISRKVAHSVMIDQRIYLNMQDGAFNQKSERPITNYLKLTNVHFGTRARWKPTDHLFISGELGLEYLYRGIYQKKTESSRPTIIKLKGRPYAQVTMNYTFQGKSTVYDQFDFHNHHFDNGRKLNH